MTRREKNGSTQPLHSALYCEITMWVSSGKNHRLVLRLKSNPETPGGSTCSRQLALERNIWVPSTEGRDSTGQEVTRRHQENGSSQQMNRIPTFDPPYSRCLYHLGQRAPPLRYVIYKILQCSCLENPMDRGAWRATVQGDKKESDPIQQLNNNSDDVNIA